MKRNLLLAFACLVMLALVPACSWWKVSTSDKDIKTITTSELRGLQAKEKDRVALVDVRPVAKHEAGHIPGSINIALPDIVEGDRRLGNAKVIVVYGSGYQDYLSPAAAKRLMALGYKNVHDYRGGVELWQDDGGKLVGNAITPAP